jgi:hypothetical protein
MGNKRRRVDPTTTTTSSSSSAATADDGKKASSTSFEKEEDPVIPSNSISVAGRELPPLPSNYDESNPDIMGSILLFYQYKEPMWTTTEFNKVLKDFIRIGNRHNITGRGRIATEGINCTLTGSSINIRQFCLALRSYDPLFDETDFKITDLVPKSQIFKSLSVRKTDELVAYGLEKDKAPSIKQFGGTHLDAIQYHLALQDPNTVVIDVSSYILNCCYYDLQTSCCFF